MNSNVERSLNPMVGDALSRRDSPTRPAERLPRRFRHPDREQADREQRVRLEERRKERGRIARELHDTLFQGFLGASLLLQATVDQTPADSPTKSTNLGRGAGKDLESRDPRANLPYRAGSAAQCIATLWSDCH